MDPLSAEEVRVAGCLIEKQLATPEYYPLTLNSLVTACNQSSNRNPVVSYDDTTVTRALEALRAKTLTRVIHTSGQRALKYRHLFDDVLELPESHLAVLAVLFLRGPQTPGELRARTERLHRFTTPEDVERVLRDLAGRDDPLTRDLGRRAGQKEDRWAHLLSGEPAEPPATASAAAAVGLGPLEARLRAVETELARLRDAHETLRREHDALRAELS